ncbi:MAG: YadA-like family protein [Dialister pneumosintes]
MNKKYIKKSAFLAMAISAVLMGSTTNVYADSTEDRLSKVEALVETKAAQGAVDSLEQRKANKTDLENLKNKVEQKAEKCEVDALKEKVEKKADKSYVDDELKKKADKSQVNALEQKVEKKADKTYVDTELKKKANKSYVDDELKKKADKSDLEKETKERKEADAQLASNVNELQGEIKSVASMSAALAALKPLNYNPNAPLQIMTGYGHYRGKSATALGIAYYKNENNLFHMGVSYAGNKNVAANAGVTWSIGSGVSRSMHTDAVTNAELMALQNKVHQFEERDRMQQEMIESMQKQIAELTEMMMMNK